MYALATDDHLIFYKISQEVDGFTLRIWEKSASWHQNNTYLYILNYQAASITAAQEVLTRYLASNGQGAASHDHSLPLKGKVRLLPHATWGPEAKIANPD
ncbi:MAG: hypothetical protein VKL98_09930 [Cyanobacteriota bacterium]|nr:hypothetical protein [Cyanobacteriota bacterium]